MWVWWCLITCSLALSECQLDEIWPCKNPYQKGTNDTQPIRNTTNPSMLKKKESAQVLKEIKWCVVGDMIVFYTSTTEWVHADHVSEVVMLESHFSHMNSKQPIAELNSIITHLDKYIILLSINLAEIRLALSYNFLFAVFVSRIHPARWEQTWKKKPENKVIHPN